MFLRTVPVTECRLTAVPTGLAFWLFTALIGPVLLPRRSGFMARWGDCSPISLYGQSRKLVGTVGRECSLSFNDGNSMTLSGNAFKVRMCFSPE